MDEILCLAHLNVGFVICILRLRFHASSAESLQSAPFANSLAIISGIYFAIYIFEGWIRPRGFRWADFQFINFKCKRRNFADFKKRRDNALFDALIQHRQTDLCFPRMAAPVTFESNWVCGQLQKSSNITLGRCSKSHNWKISWLARLTWVLRAVSSRIL